MVIHGFSFVEYARAGAATPLRVVLAPGGGQAIRIRLAG